MRLLKPFVTLLAVTAIASLVLFMFPASSVFANRADPPHQPSLRQEAFPLGIRIGSAVNESALVNDTQYAQILGQQFSSITPENEMKWASVEAQRGVLTFGPADTEVQFAQQHHMLVRGHNLVWHSQLPDWVTSGTFTNAQLSDILRQHIFQEAGHFRGKIWQWDVVNEPFNEDGTLRSTIWSNALGPNYIAQALWWTHLADPHAKLFLNDFNIEGLGAKSDAMYALVKSLKAQHVPIDGVGFETHLGLQFGLPANIQQNMQRFAALGLEISITEMDVRMILPATPDLLAQQASVYAQLMQDCISVPRCVDFTVWEYTDKYSWVPGFFTGQGSADIYDENFNPKPAYFSLIDALDHPVSHRRHLD